MPHLTRSRSTSRPTKSALGTRVDVRHLVATPVGRDVAGHAEVSDGGEVRSGLLGSRLNARAATPWELADRSTRVPDRSARSGRQAPGKRSLSARGRMRAALREQA